MARPAPPVYPARTDPRWFASYRPCGGPAWPENTSADRHSVPPSPEPEGPAWPNPAADRTRCFRRRIFRCPEPAYRIVDRSDSDWLTPRTAYATVAADPARSWWPRFLGYPTRLPTAHSQRRQSPRPYRPGSPRFARSATPRRNENPSSSTLGSGPRLDDARLENQRRCAQSRPPNAGPADASGE